MRLGAYPAALAGQPRRGHLRRRRGFQERHRHRYEVNTAYRERLEARACASPACRPTACCRRSSNIRTIPGSSACSIHPELKSRPFEPHPAVRQLHRRGGGAEPAGLAAALIWQFGRKARRGACCEPSPIPRPPRARRRCRPASSAVRCAREASAGVRPPRHAPHDRGNRQSHSCTKGTSTRTQTAALQPWSSLCWDRPTFRCDAQRVHQAAESVPKRWPKSECAFTLAANWWLGRPPTRPVT
jgi:hypothetical protein